MKKPDLEIAFSIFSKRITAEFIFKGQNSMKLNGNLLPCLFLRLLHTRMIAVINS